MQKNEFVSSKVNPSVMSARDAYEKYVELEQQYNRANELVKLAKNRSRADYFRTRKKNIRREQNLLYPIIAKAKKVAKLQRELGLSASYVLYKRYEKFLIETQQKG